MRKRSLYQTAKFCDADEIENKGPIFCEDNIAWLGHGYYFWDSCIDDAIWWGKKHYNDNYVICMSYYDYDSYDFLDLVGNTDHIDYIFNCSKNLYLRRQKRYTVGEVIEIAKRIDKNFKYKAVRAWPIPKSYNAFKLYFEDRCMFYLPVKSKIQMCVIDKSFMLDNIYKVIFSSVDRNECI